MHKPFRVVFVLYPRVTHLDFTGPHEVLAMLPGARCELASTTGEDFVTDSGLAFTQLRRLADIEHCDLLCVPGGMGTFAALEDQQLLQQLRRLASTARYVTSVCSGSLLLGAAGLLRGKRATSHWAFADALAAFGALVTRERVVRDGALFTGGGVTAGIDFALTIAAEIAGPDFAQLVQLGIEYAPAPPFSAGSPDTAPAAILAVAQQSFRAFDAEQTTAIARAAARLEAAPVAP